MTAVRHPEGNPLWEDDLVTVIRRSVATKQVMTRRLRRALGAIESLQALGVRPAHPSEQERN